MGFQVPLGFKRTGGPVPPMAPPPREGCEPVEHKKRPHFLGSVLQYFPQTTLAKQRPQKGGSRLLHLHPSPLLQSLGKETLTPPLHIHSFYLANSGLLPFIQETRVVLALC